MNLYQILTIFEKKMIVRANVFPRLQTVKSWVDISLKSAVSERSLAVNMWKRHKYAWALLSFFLITLIRNELQNISFIEILQVFVNILTGDEKFPLGDSGDLQFPIQMELS